MLKVMTIVGTRPEIIRLSRVIDKLDRHCEHVLVHTGQNYDYELNEVFFDELGIRTPDHFLNAAGATAAETIGQVIIAVDKVLAEHEPDALLLLGDTNSCLAAIAAKRRKVPIFHMEAGNRCFDLRVPEEINRRIVDHTADINLTYSQIAREYLLREGLPPDQVIVTGSPMREVIEHYRPGSTRPTCSQRLGLERRPLLRGQRAPRGKRRRAGAPGAGVRHPECAGRAPRRAGDRLDAPAHPKADRALSRAVRTRWCSSSSRSASSTTSSCRRRRAPWSPTAAPSPKSRRS